MTPEELRKIANDEDGVRWYGSSGCVNENLTEAADTIERLEREVERLKEAVAELEELVSAEEARANERGRRIHELEQRRSPNEDRA